MGLRRLSASCYGGDRQFDLVLLMAATATGWDYQDCLLPADGTTDADGTAAADGLGWPACSARRPAGKDLRRPDTTKGRELAMGEEKPCRF
jgi:hypothetical protein